MIGGDCQADRYKFQMVINLLCKVWCFGFQEISRSAGDKISSVEKKHLSLVEG
jgi:hypothetical protein